MDRTKTITIGDVCKIICKHCVKAHGGCSYKWNCPLLTEIAKYIDRKTENSSEKPNNYEDRPQTCYTCEYEWRDGTDEPCVYCYNGSKYKPKDEPQTNGYQTFNGTSVYVSRLEDEPQTEREGE